MEYTTLYKYQEKQDNNISRNRTKKRKNIKSCNHFYQKFSNIIDPYWWSLLNNEEKNIIYRGQLNISNDVKEIWIKDMYEKFNKKSEIRDSKISEILL